MNRLDGVETYTFSPSLGFALGERGGAFIEAGYSDSADAPATAVAGGGFTWMATPMMQLDISADFGLNGDPGVISTHAFCSLIPPLPPAAPAAAM